METQIEYMTRRLKQFRDMKPEVTLPIQRDFPNCTVRYTKCCTDDKEFWEKYQKRVKELDYKVQPFRAIKRNDPPKGF